MKHLLLKGVILLLLLIALFQLVSCSKRLNVASCPTYRGSTVIINSHYRK